MQTHKEVVARWLDDNYIGEERTIRAIWYKMKPYIQGCNKVGYKRGKALNDKTTTLLIGSYLWDKFVSGSYSIYGNISNSERVNLGSLSIVLFTEKNTLKPFGDTLSEHITSFEYSASGQHNSYEVANIVLQLMEAGHSTVYFYGVVDHDDAGVSIFNATLEKLRQFPQHFEVVAKQFNPDWSRYEPFTQPNGKLGVELDAVYDIEELVYEELKAFLPSPLFESLAIRYKRNEVYNMELRSDEEYMRLTALLAKRDNFIWKRTGEYNYAYDFSTDNLDALQHRVSYLS